MLYHGTVAKFLPAISRDGLRPMNRHGVHLSATVDTATAVGSGGARAGDPHRGRRPDGRRRARVRVGANGVWLVAAVPPEYLGQ